MRTEATGGPTPRGRLVSLAFSVTSFALMGVMGIVGLPLLVSARATHEWMRLYARSTLGLARLLAGIEVELRGAVPTGSVIVAAKHQSLLDVYILFVHLPHARFVMKRELLWMPVFGLYTWRIGVVTVVRGKRGEAGRMLASMAESAAAVPGGQIVVYPQGTRVAPGAAAPYRRGAAMMAEALGRPVVPAATNTGHFWAKGGRLSGPGTAVVEFLPSMPADDPVTLLPALEAAIEPASARLSAGVRR